MSQRITLPGVRPGTVPVLALGCGVMVGNIYLCQPLLAQIAQDFGVPERSAGLVAAATQVGYALGILFVVPLADMAAPARLVRWLLILTTLGLVGAALSPGIPLLIAASLALATVTVVPQILMPLAPTLVAPENRGRIVGSLTTGLVMGILLSRTFSGTIAELTGTWRAPFAAAAVLTALLSFFLPKFVPDQGPNKDHASYRSLMASLPPLLRHKPLLLSMAINFFMFGTFSALWATLSFHLAGRPFGMGPAAAGLFGLWGAPGALLAPMAGRLSDRWGSAPVNAMAMASVALALIVAATLGETHILALVIAVNLLDFGIQSGQVANQTRIFGLGDAIRGRVNTLYMVATFSGGALGALGGGLVWTHYGWHGVCVLGGVWVVCAAVILGSFARLRRQPFTAG
jgi:predicted MFS family arabinose efflux permease